MVLGYAYPAFVCFKTVENHRVKIEELRFWCQYWYLILSLSIFSIFDHSSYLYLACSPRLIEELLIRADNFMF